MAPRVLTTLFPDMDPHGEIDRAAEEEFNLLYPPPDTWVDFDQFLFRGIRREKEALPLSAFVQRLDEPEAPLAAEAHLTIYHALADVTTVASPEMPVMRRLTQMADHYRQQAASGRITAEQLAELLTNLEAIRRQHQAATEENINWFLATRFRMFDNTPPPRKRLTRQQLETMEVWPEQPVPHDLNKPGEVAVIAAGG